MAEKNLTKITAEPGKQEFFITREFDAPREQVFQAFTDPARLVHWLGPRDLTMKVDRFEPGSGGSYRYLHSDQAGNEFGFHGVTHEEANPDRIIRTVEFEGLPERGHVSLETATFEALPGGRTRVTIHSVFQSVADRDSMFQTGMEKGVNESHERLDELLTRLQR